jgi:hypothetical protein
MLQRISYVIDSMGTSCINANTTGPAKMCSVRCQSEPEAREPFAVAAGVDLGARSDDADTGRSSLGFTGLFLSIARGASDERAFFLDRLYTS